MGSGTGRCRSSIQRLKVQTATYISSRLRSPALRSWNANDTRALPRRPPGEGFCTYFLQLPRAQPQQCPLLRFHNER